MNVASTSSESWFDTISGRLLVDAERERLQGLLSRLYGPIAVQISRHGYPDLLQASEAILDVFVDDQTDRGGLGVKVCAVAEALPFAATSVGVVLLPHVLEFSNDPHQILREVKRILVPEGHLVLLGFNPISLWGFRKLLTIRSALAPWSGRYYSLFRIKDWLQVLGFEINAGAMACYRPPTSSVRLNERMKVLEKAGERWWPMTAAAYIVVARKREFGMTGLSLRWKQKQRLTPGLVEPVTKNGAT